MVAARGCILWRYFLGRCAAFLLRHAFLLSCRGTSGGHKRDDCARYQQVGSIHLVLHRVCCQYFGEISYVRQAFQPILESPVTIQEADRPIGTHVFTAMERIGDADIRWSVVSLDSGHPDGSLAEPHRPTRGRSGRDGEPISADPAGAKAALDRIAIPQDILDRIAGMAWPRSSLIISDEALSSETGKGTEFVVVMSGEPQGGIKFRRRGLETAARYVRSRDDLPFWRSPLAGPFSTW